jgi:hypothetical protein
MTTALNQSLCGCTQPWQIHQQIVTYYTAVPERSLFVVTWWVRAHGLWAPPARPALIHRLRDRVWSRGDRTTVDDQGSED